MKKIYLALMSLIVILSACSKEQIQPNFQSISVSELSQAVTNTIAENYPDADIIAAYRVSNSDADFIVELNTAEMLAVNSNGQLIENAKALNRGRGKGPRGPHGGGPGHGSIRDTVPAAIVNYINTNYPNDTILGARKDSTCAFGLVLNVLISDGLSVPKRLVFSLSNNAYLYRAERVRYTTLPQVVRDTINVTFSNYNIRAVSEKLTLANTQINYNAFLHQIGVRNRMMVTIQDNGIIVCTK
jgi:hypothetical protein